MKTILSVIALLAIVSAHNTPPLQSVITSQNQFSSNLYDALRRQSNTANLVTSPLSVSTVSAMLLQGASGATADAIRRALQVSVDNKELNTGYQALLQHLETGDDDITVEMVNRIFLANDFSLNPNVATTLETFYDAEPSQVNFANPAEAATIINNFVANATNNTIQELFGRGDLTQDVRLALVNAIYFRGDWRYRFPRERTNPKDFHISEGTPVQVQMMNNDRARVPYNTIEELDAQAILLPYEGGANRFNMLFILPNKRAGLAEVESKLQHYPLERVVNSLQTQFVNISIPRFTLESTLNLAEPMETLGAGVIFTPAAELSNFAEGGQEKLRVAKFLQKAYLQVNEEGSLAAAATGVSIVPVSLILPDQQFYADRPFFVALLANVDNQQVPLFLARVTGPQ